MKTKLILLILLITSWLAADPFLDSLQTKLPEVQGQHRYEILRTLTKLMRELDTPRSLVYAVQQKAAADELAQASFQMDARKNLAIAWYENGFYGFSETEITELKEMYTIANLPAKIAYINLVLGDIQIKKLNYSIAYNYYLEALGYYKDNFMQIEIAEVFSRLGYLSSLQNKLDEALYNYQTAEKLYDENDKDVKRSETFLEIAEIEQQQGDYKSGWSHSGKAANTYENKVMLVQMVDAVIYQSNFAEQLDKEEWTLKNLQRIYRLMAGVKNEKAQILLLVKMAELTLDNDRSTSHDYLLHLEDLLKNAPLSEFSLEFNKKLYNLYQLMGDNPKAEKYFRSYWQEKSRLQDRDRQSWQEILDFYAENNLTIIAEKIDLQKQIKTNWIKLAVSLLVIWAASFPILIMINKRKKLTGGER